jgi:hypothetical protein
MTSFTRTALTDFDFGIPVYAGATVSAWTVDTFGNKTAFLATLYADLTSSATLSNPQTLDGFGKWSQPIYINTPVILTVTGANGVPDHQTGVISANLAGSSASDAATSAASAAGFFGSVSDIFTRVRSLYSKFKTLGFPLVLVATQYLRANAAGNGYEFRSASQTRGDLGLGTAALGNTGTQAQIDAFTAGIVPTADQVASRLLFGGCRLTLAGGLLTLKPFNGNKVYIPSVGLMTVPAAGITLAVGAALTEGGTPVASTVYQVYVFSNAGTLTLQASATTHATDATTGVEIRSGDNTRALVGMARTTAGVAWADTAAQRFTLSYFNRRRIGAQNTLSADVSTASATYIELSATARAEFLTWSDEAVEVFGSGGVVNSNASSDDQFTSIGIDGTTAEDTFARGQCAASGWDSPFGLFEAKSSLTEGYHYATLLGHATSQSLTWKGGATPGARCSVGASIRG